MRSTYSPSIAGTHHLFFPPRLEAVAREDYSCGLTPESTRYPALYGFRRHQSHRPPRPPLWWRAAHHRDHRCLLRAVEQWLRLGPRLIAQGALQSLFPVAMTDAPRLPRVATHRFGGLPRGEPISEKERRADATPFARRHLHATGLHLDQPLPVFGRQLQRHRTHLVL